MHLAIVTQFPRDPDYPYGGVEAVSVNLVQRLSSYEDLNIDVITLDDEIPNTQVYNWHGVKIHRLPKRKCNELFNAVYHGRKVVSAYLDNLKPDIIHAHDTYGIMTKGLSYPRVFTVHGFIYGDTLLSGKKFPFFRAQIWKYIETRSWADQPHIISISPYVRERVSRYSRSIIHDIDNPISADFFDLTRDEKSHVVFSAAVISPRKNTLNLIYAIEHLVRQGLNIELRLAGSVANSEYGDKVLSTIKERSLEKCVTLLGRINSTEIKKQLTQCSIFALVSYEENSPMGIEEAMAAGVPIVTSNMCGMPYMVRDGENGYLVDPSNYIDIAKYIKEILENDAMKLTMQECSKSIALERFHPDVVAQKTYLVYKRILEE